MVMREVKLCKTLSTPSILFSILLVTYYNIKNIKAYIPITGVMDADSKWGGGGTIYHKPIYSHKNPLNFCEKYNLMLNKLNT